MVGAAMSNPFRANNVRASERADLHAILQSAGATAASRSQHSPSRDGARRAAV